MNAQTTPIPETADLLERVRALISLEKEDGKRVSDYAVAKRLGFSTSRISHYLSGKHTLDEDGCARVAKALDLPLETVLACVYLERAKKQDNVAVTNAWERICRRVALAFTPVFIGYLTALLAISDTLSI